MENSNEEKILNEYISVYDKKIQDTCLYLRRFISKKHPKANQLIYNGYNTVSIAFALSEKLQDAFCHLALYKKHVNLGFNRGAEIENPELKLEGNGKLIRHYKVSDLKNVPEEELAVLLKKAVEISRLNNPGLKMDTRGGKLFIKSTSGKKRRP